MRQTENNQKEQLRVLRWQFSQGVWQWSAFQHYAPLWLRRSSPSLQTSPNSPIRSILSPPTKPNSPIRSAESDADSAPTLHAFRRVPVIGVCFTLASRKTKDRKQERCRRSSSSQACYYYRSVGLVYRSEKPLSHLFIFHGKIAQMCSVV